ncbi:glycosyltransferase family 2 protein [Lachnoclostridium sp. Marseille-P6806]|uniref:glycosyltransferase family 2 protein n=1 Tax=Lachnoclostridium sp. Marseille-P6806 TaxID=2364793 RepID=UPI001030E12D|nr:glycosyltransferase family 2 protein [Lachnoclostridium sp. Marseille-P6806]
MKLSVIVPVYNMADGGKLNRCLDSLTGQSFLRRGGEMEILAVDDCSSDGSYDILREYAARYSFIRALRCDRNRKQGGAKNLGLSLAEGEWIGFLDADDWVSPDYYDKLLSRAEETGADMVGCDYCLTEEFSFRVGKIVHNNRPEQTGVLNEVKYRSLILDSGSLVVKIYRRDIILGCDSRFPEDMFYEDNALANTWMLRAKHFEYLPYPGELRGSCPDYRPDGGAPEGGEPLPPLYYYYQHESSTVHTVTKQRLLDRMEAGRRMLLEAKRYGYFEKYREEIEFSFAVLFYVNTLFSAMRGLRSGCLGFVTALAKEMRDAFPDFRQNRYYKERIGREEQKYIALQQRHPLRFYVQYRALWLYRDARARRLRRSGSR